LKKTLHKKRAGGVTQTPVLQKKKKKKKRKKENKLTLLSNCEALNSISVPQKKIIWLTVMEPGKSKNMVAALLGIW
jgi:hypothetical protein